MTPRDFVMWFTGYSNVIAMPTQKQWDDVKKALNDITIADNADRQSPISAPKRIGNERKN
jgi:hypothetical protein